MHGRRFSLAPPDDNRFWTLSTVDIAIFNRENFNLLIDIEQLHGMSEHMSEDHIGYVS